MSNKTYVFSNPLHSNEDELGESYRANQKKKKRVSIGQVQAGSNSEAMWSAEERVSPKKSGGSRVISFEEVAPRDRRTSSDPSSVKVTSIPNASGAFRRDDEPEDDVSRYARSELRYRPQMRNTSRAEASKRGTIDGMPKRRVYISDEEQDSTGGSAYESRELGRTPKRKAFTRDSEQAGTTPKPKTYVRGSTEATKKHKNGIPLTDFVEVFDHSDKKEKKTRGISKVERKARETSRVERKPREASRIERKPRETNRIERRPRYTGSERDSHTTQTGTVKYRKSRETVDKPRLLSAVEEYIADKLGAIRESASQTRTVTLPIKVFKIAAIVIGVIAVGAGAVFGVRKLCSVSTINVYGTADKKQVIALSNLNYGECIFDVNTALVEENISHSNPYLLARVNKKGARCINITVTERKAYAAVEYRDGYALIDYSGLVLEFVSRADINTKKDYLCVVGLSTVGYQKGERIGNRVNEPAVNDLLTLLEAIDSTGMKKDIIKLDVSNSNVIRLVTKDRLNVVFGDVSNAVSKLECISDFTKEHQQDLDLSSYTLRVDGIAFNDYSYVCNKEGVAGSDRVTGSDKVVGSGEVGSSENVSPSGEI